MAVDLTRYEESRVSYPRSLEIGTSPLTFNIEYHPNNLGPPDVWDLAYIQQLPGESIRQFLVGFFCVKNKILDYLDSDIIMAFQRGCKDKGVSNALARRCVQTLPELSNLVS